jgi:hypothetical protein
MWEVVGASKADYAGFYRQHEVDEGLAHRLDQALFA